MEREELLASLVAGASDIESMHRVFLLMAARPEVEERVRDFLSGLWGRGLQSVPARAEARAHMPPPIYSLAKDYAAYLKSWAIGIDALKQTAKRSLDEGPSFDEWSFA
jgi:hypothetical protein